MIFGIDQIQVAFERVRIHQQVFLRPGQLSFLPVSQYANGWKQKKNPRRRAVPKTKAARLLVTAGPQEGYFVAGFAGSDDSTKTAVGIGPLAEAGLAMAACWSDSIASFDIRSVNSCKVDMPLDSANWKPDFSATSKLTSNPSNPWPAMWPLPFSPLVPATKTRSGTSG